MSLSKRSCKRSLVRVLEILLADDPDPWIRAGFLVGRDGAILLGSPLRPLVLRLVGRTPSRRGIVGWRVQAEAVNRVVDCDLDTISCHGLLTELDSRGFPAGFWPEQRFQHPNGVRSLDQLVVLTRHPEQLIQVLAEELGLSPRRERKLPKLRQIFFRTEHFILEV